MKWMYNQKGLTLVEVIITIGILGIVLSMIGSVFLYGNRSYSRGITQYQLQSETRLALSQISGLLQMATELEVVTLNEAKNHTGPNSQVLYLDHGQLIHRLLDSSGVATEKSLVSEGLDGNLSDFSSVEQDVLQLVLYLVDSKSKQTFSTDMTIKLLNMGGTTGRQIQGLSVGPGIIFYVPTTARQSLTSIARLDQITASFGTLSPSFSPGIFRYNLSLPSGSTTIPHISAVGKDGAYVVGIQQASSTSNQALITVRSADGRNTRVYEVMID